MTVVQVFLKIPDGIIKKIDTGEYKIIGGVVRDNKGQLVKHLSEASKTEIILHYAWNNRDTLIKIGKSGYKLTRHYFDSKKVQQPVVKFKKAFKVYLDAVCKGALTTELISDMMERLDEVKRIPNYEKINIPLSMQEIDLLMNGLFEYTNKLASDNAIELTGLEKKALLKSENLFTNLECFLKTQNRIFKLSS
ncbi:hypothetical protein [Paucisalibacillus globulus]|uniref:hypothetical protein n=1 Tax=Paucisalibacillus globulus TaxID=351095 RepID=UPI000412924F|nr:hypothetical protein [Paucisalibacillus globulus]